MSYVTQPDDLYPWSDEQDEPDPEHDAFCEWADAHPEAEEDE